MSSPNFKNVYVLERNKSNSSESLSIPINPKTGKPIPAVRATPGKLLKKTFFIKKRKKDGKIVGDYSGFKFLKPIREKSEEKFGQFGQIGLKQRSKSNPTISRKKRNEEEKVPGTGTPEVPRRGSSINNYKVIQSHSPTKMKSKLENVSQSSQDLSTLKKAKISSHLNSKEHLLDQNNDDSKSYLDGCDMQISKLQGKYVTNM